MHRRALCTILLLTTVTAMASAEDPPPLPRSAPEAVGLSSSRLARFDVLAAQAVEEAQVPGVVAWVIRRGHVVYETAQGTLDVETGRPMRPDTIFRIASETKLMVSVAALALVEEGRLLLDDPVGRYLPGFQEMSVAVEDGETLRLEPATRPITVLDLLTHTSGISFWSSLPPALQRLHAGTSWGPELLVHRDAPIGALVEELADLPLAAQPGERFLYGWSSDVLGAVLEKAAGQPLDELMRARVFEPLRLRDTHFYLPPEKTERLAANHNPVDGGGLRRAPEDDRSWTGQGAWVVGPRRAFSGDGGLLSTAPDYARLLLMLIRGGELDGTRVLSPASVRLLTTDQVGGLYARDEGVSGFGFGFNVEVKLEAAATGWDVPQLASVGSWGWGGALGTHFWVDQEEELIGIFMTQLRPARSDLHRRFANIVYGALDPSAKHRPPSPEP